MPFARITSTLHQPATSYCSSNNCLRNIMYTIRRVLQPSINQSSRSRSLTSHVMGFQTWEGCIDGCSREMGNLNLENRIIVNRRTFLIVHLVRRKYFLPLLTFLLSPRLKDSLFSPTHPVPELRGETEVC